MSRTRELKKRDGLSILAPPRADVCVCGRVGDWGHTWQIEWFHFECVGLPREGHGKGKWYCPDCAAAKKRGKR